jgi:tRNA(fMet)-specific endonuclease VapC
LDPRQRRNAVAGILQQFGRLQVGEAAISVITFGELIYGAEKSEQRDAAMRQLEELASLLPLPAGARYWRAATGSSPD